MATNLLDFDAANPLRPPDWRWRRAGVLLAERLPLSRRRDDEWVGRCYRFRRGHAACDGYAGFHALAAAYPGLYWAHDLYSTKDLGRDAHGPLGYMLEARLLADQAPATIATRCGIPAAVVEAYHDCFFEVRPHLAHTDYLMAKVVGEAAYRGLRDRNYDLLWKMFAIWAGEFALESLIATFVAPTRPADAAAMAGFVHSTVHGKLAMKAMSAAQSVEVNNFTAVEIIDKYLKVYEIEREAGGGGAGQLAAMQGINRIMAGLPYASGRRPSESFDRTPARVDARLAHDNSAVELTGEELVRLGAGEVIEVDDRPLPPPPRRAVGRS